jgi:hypothetical protein
MCKHVYFLVFYGATCAVLTYLHSSLLRRYLLARQDSGSMCSYVYGKNRFSRRYLLIRIPLPQTNMSRRICTVEAPFIQDRKARGLRAPLVPGPNQTWRRVYETKNSTGGVGAPLLSSGCLELRIVLWWRVQSPSAERLPYEEEESSSTVIVWSYPSLSIINLIWPSI